MNHAAQHRAAREAARSPTEADDARLSEGLLETSLRMYPERAYRVGMRSGMMDAATVCDMIAAQIARTGGKNQRTRDAMALAKRCGDAIMAMRDGVEVPPQ